MIPFENKVNDVWKKTNHVLGFLVGLFGVWIEMVSAR